MRLIEGRDLGTVLAAGPLEPASAVDIIDQVAKGLNAADKIGLVHRDVKPSNILLDDDDHAYLIDFGIARTADEPGLTTTGGVVGSFAYMAPERFTSRDVDTRSDIYGLTCVLYECLTGKRPFPCETLQQQLAAHLGTAPPRPSKANPRLSTNFDAVIAKGMAKGPDERYATTLELVRAAHAATKPAASTPSARLMPMSIPTTAAALRQPRARRPPRSRH